MFQSPPEEWDSSGAFETCRVRHGKVRHIQEHLDRLSSSLKTLGIPFTGREKIQRDLQRHASGIKEGFIRIALRREGDRRIIFHINETIPYSNGHLSKGVVIKTVPTPWPSRDISMGRVKQSERLPHILAKIEGTDAHDVLRIGPLGLLTEGAVSNFFLVKDKVLFTPPLWLGILDGVTRNEVLHTARAQKIHVKEIPLTRHDLFNADEAFLTNVLMKIAPIANVDGRKIGTAVPGVLTKRLMENMERR